MIEFSKPLTLAAGNNRLVDLMVAAGHTGSFGATQALFKVETGSGPVSFASVAMAAATDGGSFGAGEGVNRGNDGNIVDLTSWNFWSDAGGDRIFVSANTY